MARSKLTIATTLLALAASTAIAGAAELRVLSPVAFRAAMPEIVAQFEASGHKIKIEYATAGAIVERLQKGEAADVAISSTPHVDGLLGQGKIAAGTRAQFARVGIGVFIRDKEARPDLSSADTFKRALLDAKAIGYGDPAKGGVSGVAMAALVDLLGVAADLKTKTRFYQDSQAVLSAVAGGEVTIGIGLTSDRVLSTGAELVGGLPAQIQSYTYYAGGVVVGSSNKDASAKLVAFLTSAPAKAILTSKGFEPQ